MQLNSKTNGEPAGYRWWIAVARDVHFWIPLAVLLAGLLALHWIH